MLNNFQAGWLAILGQQCFNFPFFKKTTKPLISLCMGVCVCMPTSSHWWGPKDRQLAGNLCRLPTIWSQPRIELRSTLALAASASSHWAPSLGFFFFLLSNDVFSEQLFSLLLFIENGHFIWNQSWAESTEALSTNGSEGRWHLNVTGMSHRTGEEVKGHWKSGIVRNWRAKVLESSCGGHWVPRNSSRNWSRGKNYSQRFNTPADADQNRKNSVTRLWDLPLYPSPPCSSHSMNYTFCVWRCAHAEPRGQLAGVSSLLSSRGAWRSNRGR